LPTLSDVAPVGFDAIQVGHRAEFSRTITAADLDAFAAFSGDYNPLHMDEAFAHQTTFGRRVAHGMILGSMVSRMIGMHLPGPGALWTQQQFRWMAPVFAGDTVTVEAVVRHKSSGANTLTIEVKAVNQDGKTVLEGEGTVMMAETREHQADRALSERCALVTGASRGIGAAIAAALGRAGAAVAVNYRESEAEAEAVCRAIREEGGHAVALRADVGDAAAVAAAVAQASQAFGRAVDVLVNNAGAAPTPQPFLETAWEDLERMFHIQVRGAFNCCRAVIPGMVDNRSGRIVNIGSTLTWSAPPPNWTGFLMAKSALKAMTHSLAAEFGPHGIRVNMVSPGMTGTGSIAAISERLRKVQAMQTPLRRLANPEDVARTVLFLCAEGGEFVSGADIPVCGGAAM
jgi:3-oxoacyl-[acyl-carrier protein] reductase